MMPELEPLILNPPPNIIKVVDEASLSRLEDFFTRVKTLGYDVETTPLKDFYFRRMRTKQYGTEKEQYVVDLLAFCDYDSTLLANVQGDFGKNLKKSERFSKLLKTLGHVNCSDEWLKVGVVLSFEYMSDYWLFGQRTQKFWDCSLIEKVIQAGNHPLKDYSYFGMEEMLGRYFGKSIDKSLQESFNLTGPLSDEQYEYAALDTRTPLAFMGIQKLIVAGHKPAQLVNAPIKQAYLLRHDPLVLGDNLEEICEVENTAIGSFQDMYVHGEHLDIDPWKARLERKEKELQTLYEYLDSYFIPLVGNKNDIITDEIVEKARQAWKAL